jgi:hypothetical protein
MQVSNEVTFVFGDDKHWGFLELTIDGATIKGSYTAVDKAGGQTPGADTFTLGGR